MKHYGIENEGEMILEIVSGLPVHTTADKGRVLYDDVTGKMYYGTATTWLQGVSGYSGIATSGYSGYSGLSGYSGYSGISGYSSKSGFSGISGYSSASGFSGISGYSSTSGFSGISGYSGIGTSGYSGIGTSGYSGVSAYSGYSGKSGYSGAGISTGATVTIATTATDGTDDNSQFYLQNGDAQNLAIIWHSSQSAPEETPNTHGRLASGRIYATVWNDFADYLPIDNEIKNIEYGKVYVRDENGLTRLSNKYCEKGIIGIVSDTFGHSVGYKNIGNNEIPLSVAGFVLAYVDKEYVAGTPLTCDKNGVLTKMGLIEKILYPERLIATYHKSEQSELWNEIIVNKRKWVKVC
jgi:hypothetical protein